MTATTVLREYHLAVRELCLIPCQISFPARRVPQVMRCSAFEKEQCHSHGLPLRRSPVAGVATRDGDLDGSGALAADKRIEVQEPLLRSEERRVGKECRSRWSPYH